MNPLLHLPYKLVLASKSPRRSQLLREAGFDFEIRTLDTDESYPAHMPVETVPEYMAVKKAEAMLPYIEGDELLLTADTVVILDGVIFGKPVDATEATEMLRQMSGRSHQVITGVCLMTTDSKTVLSDESLVYFDELTAAEMTYYIAQYQPYDKAGSYGIQEWIGHCKINRIDGSYANVMGLPVHRVYEALQSMSRELS
jgi:septum formation protein